MSGMRHALCQAPTGEDAAAAGGPAHQDSHDADRLPATHQPLPLSSAQPVSRYVRLLEREIHYTEWLPDGRVPVAGANPAGPLDPRPVVMAWHGLARTGRDMDDIAGWLAPRYRVICPDTLGRGLSQWSPDPGREYQMAFYAQLAEALLDALGIDACLWLGTSMGGAIGITAAAGRLRGRIRRMVINDIGPELAQVALDRIRSYAGQPAAFATVSELEAYFRTIYAPYGWLSDAQWRRLTETSVRRLPDGRVTPHYDPAMVRQFIDHPNDYALWPQWDALSLPVLCLRGADSDLLQVETAEAMKVRGPRARVVTVEGCGHAPALNVREQVELVEGFLAG